MVHSELRHVQTLAICELAYVLSHTQQELKMSLGGVRKDAKARDDEEKGAVTKKPAANTGR